MEQEKDLFGHTIGRHCNCKWCTETSPGIKRLIAKIGEDIELRRFFDSFVLEYMQYECDAEYYKCICDGEWQRDRAHFDETINFLIKKRDERFPVDKPQ